MRLERLEAVTDAALGYLELDELLAELLARTRELLETDTAAVLLLDETGTELVARAAVGLEEEVAQSIRIPVGEGFAGRIAAERRPMVLDDVDHADVLNPILREKGVKSLLGAPLTVSDTVLGVIHVGTLEPRLFTPGDQQLLELVASRAALAIEKARIHQETVRLDQLKLNFVAVASHELRTPATSIYGITATLRHRGDELTQETRTELEETLWTQVNRLRLLIEQLLDLSRLDASAISIEPQPIGLRALLTEVAAETAPRAGRQDRRRRGPRGARRPAGARADHGQPRRQRASLRRPAGGRASATDGHVPARSASRTEARACRQSSSLGSSSASSAASVGEGSGLGLSIAQAYARAHGGDLIYDRSEKVVPASS